MAKKRLTFDVEENLHSRLKQLAAEQGVALGALCSGLIETGLNAGANGPEIAEVDPIIYQSLPLDKLREQVSKLTIGKPQGWETAVRRINAEIVKRYIAR